MKKAILVFLTTCMLFSAAGCSALHNAESVFEPTETVFSIDNYHLQITADSSFQEKTGGAFDLQITTCCVLSPQSPSDFPPEAPYHRPTPHFR